jgi:L-2-aminoadipate reductase
VFVPLKRMPLNPNGKIDKPALPFPDTAQAATAEQPKGTAREGTPTEKTMQEIWSRILPNAPKPIPLDENFFDLGGHSILATRLIFEVRKMFVVNAPLGLVFDQPTIGGLSAEVDALRNSDLAFAYRDSGASEQPPSHLSVPGAPAKAASMPAVEYGKDYESLSSKLRLSYASPPLNFGASPLTVFLTGATGFLGAFVLSDLLYRPSEVGKVICLIRASSAEKAMARLKELSTDRGVWDDAWVASGRLEVVIGDLGQDKFGLGDSVWQRVASEADIVLHNGALVSPGTRVTHFILIGSRRYIGFIPTRNSGSRTFWAPLQLSSLLPTGSRSPSSSFLQPLPSTWSIMCACLMRCRATRMESVGSRRRTTWRAHDHRSRQATVKASGSPKSFFLKQDVAD